ncbi:MAG: TonB-dependent receptor [Ignavibacteria bacterium]|nr:TonB-dependent receptor [Ignavibacteria bacterium]
MKAIILTCLFLVIPTILFSNEIIGFISDSIDNKPLAGATIRLEGTNFGTISDKTGYFRLSRIPKGNYYIIVSFIGYSSLRQKVAVPTIDTLKIKLNPKVIKTNELIITATKRLQTVQEVPVSIHIVGEEIFSKKNYVKLDEALRFVPGVVINKDNISIRGSSGFSFGVGSRTAYLLDGIPMLSGDNGDAKYDIIPTELISRVEVVKGAGSSLYGTSAIGGVVNLISREPSDSLNFILSLQSGIYTKPKYSQWHYTNSLTTKSIFSGYISGNLNFSKALIGFNLVNDESYRQFDKSFRGNVFLKLTKDFANYGKITLTGFFSSDKRNDWVFWNSLDSATKPPPRTDLGRYLISNKANLSLSTLFIISPKTFANIKTSIYNTFLDNKLPPNDPEYRRTFANSFNSEIQLSTNLFENLLLTYGLNFTANWVNSNIYGRHKQNLVSAYSQIELTRFWNSTITLGSRFDIEKSDSSKTYLELSPKLGWTFFVDPKKSIRFSIGRGFRSPNLAERFASIKYSGFEVIPNFNLKSEHSWSTELGALMEFTKTPLPFILDFSLFYSYYKDFIEPNFVQQQAKIKFDNITKARILGFELSCNTLFFKKIPYTLSILYIDPKDLNDNKILKYRSKWTILNSLTIPYKVFTITADFRYISKIERIDDMLSLQVEDYDARVPIYVLDLHFGLDLKKFRIPITLNLSVTNALDYYYVEIVGNLAPTRLVSLKLQYAY